MTYKIEKGHRRPSGRKWREPLYPFEDMCVDDSFDVPLKPGQTENQAQGRVTSAAQSFRHRHHPTWRFSTSVVNNDKGVMVVRCWRDPDRIEKN